MKKIFVLLFLLLVFNCKTNIESHAVINSQLDSSEEVSPPELQFVTSEELKETVYYLASDELKGRSTGSEGIEKAAIFIENKLKSYHVDPYFDTYRDNYKAKQMDATNIIGFIEGTDPVLKNEVIILGAHYDHIGIIEAVGGDSIANGANDDATGVAAVLAMARYFGSKKNNKRSLLFTLYSGEEIGLLGSQHLANRLLDENMTIYTMTNFEMIGVSMQNKNYQAYFTGFELSNMAQVMNASVGYDLLGDLPKAKDFKLFYRSDNYSFYKAFKKPAHAISTFDFTNFDHYHGVGDEAELMDYDFMADLINRLIPAYEIMSNTTTSEILMND